MYDDNSPKADPELFNSDIPILGICYGLQVRRFGDKSLFMISQQLLALHFDGIVKKSDSREDGQFVIDVDTTCPLFKFVLSFSLSTCVTDCCRGLSNKETVLLTHADYVESPGAKFTVVARSKDMIAGISIVAI